MGFIFRFGERASARYTEEAKNSKHRCYRVAGVPDREEDGSASGGSHAEQPD